MAAVLDGVKVVEVAGWTFVPAGGGVLADWECIAVLREGAWAVVQTPAEVLADPQVRENGYVAAVTDEILEKELGLDGDAILALKLNNTVS